MSSVPDTSSWAVDNINTSNLSYMYDDTDTAADVVVDIISIAGNVVGVASLFLNALFVVGLHFIKDSTTAYHHFVRNLSVADMLASMTFLVTQNWPRGPFAVIEPTKDFVLQEGLPYVFRSTPWLFFTGYMLTLTCLTLTQYVAVCLPLRYATIITKRTVWLSLLGVWVASSLQLLIPLTILLALWKHPDGAVAKRALYQASELEMQVWMGVYAFSTLFNILLDVAIYSRIRHLKFQHSSATHTGGSEGLSVRMKRDAFVTVSLLLIASVFGRLPFPVISLAWLSLHSHISFHTARIVNAVVVFLLYFNFFVDPIIYMSRMKEVRQAYSMKVTSVVRCCARRARSHSLGGRRFTATATTCESAYAMEMTMKFCNE